MPLNIVYTVDEYGAFGPLAEEIAYNDYLETCDLFGVEPISSYEFFVERQATILLSAARQDLPIGNCGLPGCTSEACQ